MVYDFLAWRKKAGEPKPHSLCTPTVVAMHSFILNYVRNLKSPKIKISNWGLLIYSSASLSDEGLVSMEPRGRGSSWLNFPGT